ncbi:hypothetical protein [Chitinophaga tropicalis]|uniref:Uncharacterized protein n=1 Tax=Chitinophaga tropicalis TaxID=2683588 RepID=A0A7K1UB54_9BACT|nr:hypothetical protein [Chitinophaga tropicalis]MVT11619.1 hypothetical protein [Chitinophaga tropicalis]
MAPIRKLLCIVILLCCVCTAAAQADKWAGTWYMEYKPTPNNSPIKVQLLIGQPEYNTLYPAQLKIDFATFSGTYLVLLAKKNENQLGIGRNKYPLNEVPFKLRAWMLYLNGTFNYEKKATPAISLQRMWIDSHELYMQGLYEGDEMNAYLKDLLRDLLSRRDFTLKKLNNTPWKHPDTRRILHPEEDPIYFGIYDKETVYDSIIPLTIRDEDMIDKDTVTLLHNGKILLDKAYVNEKEKIVPVSLDTGMNILTLFADNYGRLPPNTGSFFFRSDTSAYLYDFSDRANGYATFLVAQVVRKTRPAGEKEQLRIQVKETPPVKAQPRIPVKEIPAVKEDPRIVIRKTTLLDKVTFTSPVVTLDLWDDAAEDGDSISLALNGQDIVTGFPVRKQRQQLVVTLLPGENKLVMIADNLGSIPPNTAVLRVSSGALRKYVRIKTDLKQNNMLLIYYQPEGEKSSGGK